jgi:hypothetical protein
MLAPLLLLSASIQSPAYQQDRGSFLFQQCQTNIRLLDSAGKNATSNDFQDSTACLAYIEGFTDNETEDLFCPGRASIQTMSRVYVVYMTAHPKLLDDYKGVGLLKALHETYPCPSKK